MFRITSVFLLAVLAALGSAPRAGAIDAKVGVVFGSNKEGVVVAAVNGGSVADFMGLREDDKIVRFRFRAPNQMEPLPGWAQRPSLDDIRPLLIGRPGRYEIVLVRKGAEVFLSGQLIEQEIKGSKKKELVFIRDMPKR